MEKTEEKMVRKRRYLTPEVKHRELYFNKLPWDLNRIQSI